MDKPINSYEHDNYLIEVNYCTNPKNPIEESLVCYHLKHNRYDFQNDIEGITFETKKDAYEYIKNIEKAEFIYCVYMYEHSGIAFSLNDFKDSFDSGFLGFAYVTPSDIETLKLIKKVDIITEEIVKDFVEKDLKLYNAYVEGEVYEYNLYKLVTCEHCGNIGKEHIISCVDNYEYELTEEQIIALINEYT